MCGVDTEEMRASKIAYEVIIVVPFYPVVSMAMGDSSEGCVSVLDTVPS